MTAFVDLKTWPEPYQAILELRKRFEFREIRDRGEAFKVGNWISLLEWDPEPETYTGRWLYCRILYRIDGPAFGIPEGYCILSLDSPYPIG